MNNKKNSTVLVIRGLQFIVLDDIKIEYPSKMSPREILNAIELVLLDIQSIDSKGYLNSLDLGDYPIINSFVSLFTKSPSYTKGNHSMEAYKWIYNVILLTLYELSLTIKKNEVRIDSDLFSDFEILTKKLYNFLDPSIRKSLQRRGVSLIQNIHTGFDTEFVNKDPKNNQLLSVQLAINTHSYLKIPKAPKYLLSNLNPLTNKSYPISRSLIDPDPETEKGTDTGTDTVTDSNTDPLDLNESRNKNKNKNKKFGYLLVEVSIRRCIQRIREVNHPLMDRCIEALVNKMVGIPNIKYIEKEDFYIFKIPATPIKQYIHFTDEKGYSLEEMVDVSNVIGLPEINNTHSKIINLLESMYQEYLYEEEKAGEVGVVVEGEGVDDKMGKANDIEKVKGKVRENIGELFGKKNGVGLSSFVFTPDNLHELMFAGDKQPLTRPWPDPAKGRAESLKTFTEKMAKPLTRKYEKRFTPGTISVTRNINIVFVGHLTSADLSLLNDFIKFKDFLDIVNKSFVSLGKPITYAGSRLIIRDTMLLAPASQKSLSSIGKLYDIKKYELSVEEISNMDLLLKNDPAKFTEYALRDALITLTHANWMESFHFDLNGIGIPLTLSGLGNKFVEKQWEELGYEGYQISPEYLIGDIPNVNTPKGLQQIGKTGLKIGYYIANYKGGRNESFMYGYDNHTHWFDYDLTSAYTTVLFQAGHPWYESGKNLSETELKELTPEELLYSYTIVKCSFEFQPLVKYPSIPVYVNETTTVYPQKGEAYLTGAEYYLAQNQGCKFKIYEVYHIPFLTSNFPFKDIIQEVQTKRRSFPKGSVSNLMYKEIGNSIYGSLVRGMSGKSKFDNKTGMQIKIPANFLSNPLLASWVTGFIRSLVGECLHAVQKLEGKVVSVTTDGFISDIPALESKMIEALKQEDSFLLREFKKLRKELSNNEDALEIKHEGVGIISWTTRGQLGVGSTIKATTGFQNRNYTHSELVELFTSKIGSVEKTLEYLQSSLRSAISISKKGGHVTMIYKDQKFSLKYDNRRLIIDDIKVKDPYFVGDDSLVEKQIISGERDYVHSDSKRERSNNLDKETPTATATATATATPTATATATATATEIEIKNFLLDSMPVKDLTFCKNLRDISKRVRNTEFNHRTSSNLIVKNRYRNNNDLGIRNFIKCLVSNPPVYPSILAELNSYSKIIEFVHKFDPKYKISKSSISNLKNRKMIMRQVPLTEETLRFCDFVKSHFSEFDDSKFLNKRD